MGEMADWAYDQAINGEFENNDVYEDDLIKKEKGMASLETVVVGAKSKFGFKVGDTWYNPRKPLTADNFKAGDKVTILTEKYEKNGKSSVNVLQIVDAGGAVGGSSIIPQTGSSLGVGGTTSSSPAPAVKDNTTRRTSRGAEYVKAGFGKPMTDYEIELDSRISYAGIVQACVQSAALSILPVKSVEDVAKNTIQLAQLLIAEVERRVQEGK